ARPSLPRRKAEQVAWLKARGVHANDHGPVEKQPAAVLSGMVERVASREAAARAGMPPCPKHAGELVGACPICLGIWADDESDLKPDNTLVQPTPAELDVLRLGGPAAVHAPESEEETRAREQAEAAARNT